MSRVTPADALPVINQISRAAPTEADDAFVFRGLHGEGDASGIELEVHINATWTSNDAVGDARYDEFATYSNSTNNDAQADWMAFG